MAIPLGVLVAPIAQYLLGAVGVVVATDKENHPVFGIVPLGQ